MRPHGPTKEQDMLRDTFKALSKAYEAESFAMALLRDAVCLQAEEWAKRANVGMAERYRRMANTYARFVSTNNRLANEYARLANGVTTDSIVDPLQLLTSKI